MSQVVTVLGEVDPTGADWGAVDAHEHVFITGGVALERFPDLRLDDVEAASRELEEVAHAGGRVVVEATPIGLGRQPLSMADVSRRTGVHIVATTGFHRAVYYLDTHWMHQTAPARIASLLIGDLMEGIDACDYDAPWIERTEVRAGVIKIGTEMHTITKTQEKLLEAVAEAHAKTGAPVTTHLEAGTFGMSLLERLDELGVRPECVSLGHVDRNPDLLYLTDLADAGAYLIFTTPGRIKYGPDSAVVELMRRLVHAGHGDRLLVGGDMARRQTWRAYGGGPGIAWLFSGFFARLNVELGEAVTLAITVDNPGRAFCWRNTGNDG